LVEAPQRVVVVAAQVQRERVLNQALAAQLTRVPQQGALLGRVAAPAAVTAGAADAFQKNQRGAVARTCGRRFCDTVIGAVLALDEHGLPVLEGLSMERRGANIRGEFLNLRIPQKASPGL
jgi:hypothetical protein